MYSAYKLNKQGDNIRPWRTPFPIWNQSVVPCPVLTVASWPAYRFLKRQVRWYGIPISFRIFQFIVTHTIKGFGIVNKAEIDVFLELFCFFDDPAYVGNLISGSSAFFKTGLNTWKFTVHILLKLGLENFEHYFTSMWDECNCVVVWAFFRIAFLWDWNENWPFPHITRVSLQTIGSKISFTARATQCVWFVSKPSEFSRFHSKHLSFPGCVMLLLWAVSDGNLLRLKIISPSESLK